MFVLQRMSFDGLKHLILLSDLYILCIQIITIYLNFCLGQYVTVRRRNARRQEKVPNGGQNRSGGRYQFSGRADGHVIK